MRQRNVNNAIALIIIVVMATIAVILFNTVINLIVDRDRSYWEQHRL